MRYKLGKWRIKDNYKNYKVFFRYLFSYVLMLLIPVIMMYWLISNQISNILKNEIVSLNIAVLSKARDQIDMKIKDIDRMIDRIAVNPKLTPHELLKTPYSNYDGIQTLFDYREINSIVSELFLYVYGRQEIYSTRGTHSLDTFSDILYKYDLWDKNDLYQTINNVKYPYFRPSESVYVDNPYNKQPIITYVCPIPRNDPYGTILVHIQEKAMNNIIKDILKDYNGATAIIDSKGNIITSSNTGDGMQYSESTKEQKEIFKVTQEKKESQGSFDVKLEGENYLVSYIRSDNIDWTFVTIVASKKVLKKVFFIRTITLGVILLILLIGAAGIYLVMKLNYNPIKTLRKNLEMIVNGEIEKGDDFEIIHKVMDNILINNNDLKDKMLRNNHIIKEQVLMMLLSGQISNKDEFDFMAKEFNLALDKMYFRVAIFSNDAVKNISGLIIEEFNASQDEHVHIYGVKVISNDDVIAIFNMDEAAIRETDFNEYIKRQKEDLENKFNTYISVGVGRMYTDLSLVCKSYIEASSALDYRLLKGKGRIICFEDIDLNVNHNIWYPLDELENLDICIKQADLEQVNNLIKNVVDTIQEQDMPLYMARCYCFDIINTVIKVMYELNIQFNDLLGNRPNLVLLTQFETIAQFEEIIKRLCVSVCNFIKENKESRNFSLKNEIIQRLEEEYKSNNFSTKELASRFNLSQSYLSRYFKDQVGVTIVDYITQLRMKEAKRMLEFTDIPIKDIISEVGYVDITNFNRRFKSLEGISPGQYRKIIQKSN